MKRKSDVPCHNCITLAICRHREYSIMIDTCAILRNLLYKHGLSDSRYRKPGFVRRVNEVKRIHQPTRWVIEQVGNGNLAIVGII